MKKVRQPSSLLLPVTLLVVVVVAVGLYYYFELGTTTTAKEPTTTIVQNNDFQLQASVNKTEYKYGEPVTVNLKITYLGKSPIKVNMPVGCACVITVKNATESWSIHYREAIAFMMSYDFTPGQYITGTVVITGGDIQYRSGDGGGDTKPMISDKPFSGFSPGSSYYIQVRTNYLNATDPKIFSPEAELTTSPLHITITPR